MSRHKETKDMFDALRRVDSAMTPPFDQLLESLSDDAESSARAGHTRSQAARFAAIITTIAASVVFAAFIIRSGTPDDLNQPDAQSIQQICDELSARIGGLEPRQQDIQEMDWTTSTDTLLPI